MGVRGAAVGKCEFRLGATLPASPGAAGDGGLSCWPTAPCRPTNRARGAIRKNIIEAGLVDCIIALPGQLFRSTQIPACLWFLSKSRRSGARRDETLFIDARKMGHMLDRTRRDLSAEDISRVADTYHAWLGGNQEAEYADVPGFCKSASLEEIRKHGHVLTPGRYVGVEPQPDDGVPFAEKMTHLSAQWREQQAEARRLDAGD